jgi:hypothetical protein
VTAGPARGDDRQQGRNALHGARKGAGDLPDDDAARLTATGGRRVTATEPAEILVRDMHATIAA